MIQRRVSALICYETNDDGSLAEVTNDVWNYCSMIPSYYEGEKLHAGKAFGLGPMNNNNGRLRWRDGRVV
ncbi:hypothetical protein AAVH_21021 [Aphelenchoides avenae]|nr:hypothetical protein AAVH_21021 [Aphelenchus avenae]